MKQLITFILLILLFSCHKENRKANKSFLTTNEYQDKAKQYLNINSDSAFFYFNLSKNRFLLDNDSLGIARALANMAIIQTNKGDYYGGIETLLRSNNFVQNNKKNDSIARLVLSSNYNNLAIAFSNLKDYNSAVLNYKKALEYANVDNSKFIYYNNIADALLNQKKYFLAKKYLNLALKTSDSIDYAMALNNLAKVKYLEDKTYNPLPELYKALDVRKRNNNSLGENSSYATLADYFYDKDKNASLYYAKMMLGKAVENKSSDDQVEALLKIIKLDPNNYLTNFLKFQSINDSIQNARSRDKDQFAYFRYDVEGKTAENALLKNEKNQKQKQIITLIAALILSIAIIVWYRKRQIRLKQEKELEVKNTQLRLSKKVHDVVANGIYQVMTKIENQEHFDRNTALDELEFVYEKSRDISYDKADEDPEEKDFSEKISELVASFKNENTNTYIAGNESEVWNSVSPATQHEVYQVIRELLVNMRKHSQADRVVLRFGRENNRISIFYTDNGVGISDELVYKNGLQNTVSRIAAIAGSIIFDTKTEKGLKVHLSFPVS